MSLDALPDYLRAHEAADVLRVKPDRLAKDRMGQNPIPFSKLGRTVLYAKRDLVAYLEANRHQPGVSA